MIDIRKVRLFCEMTQGDLSVATGVSVTMIAKIERGGYVNPHTRKIIERFLMEKLRVELEAEQEEVSPIISRFTG